MSRPFKHDDFIYETMEGIKDSYTKGDGNNVEKRKRVKLTKEQIDRLSYYFEINCMPQLNDRVLIGNEIGVNQKTVQIWFQNRRAKIKKNEREQYEMNRFHGTAFSGFLPHDLPDLEVCNSPDTRFSIPLFHPPVYDSRLIYEPSPGHVFIPSEHINQQYNILQDPQFSTAQATNSQFGTQQPWLYRDYDNYTLIPDVSSDNNVNHQQSGQQIEFNENSTGHFKGTNNSHETVLEDNDYFYN